MRLWEKANRILEKQEDGERIASGSLCYDAMLRLDRGANSKDMKRVQSDLKKAGMSKKDIRKLLSQIE